MEQLDLLEYIEVLEHLRRWGPSCDAILCSSQMSQMTIPNLIDWKIVYVMGTGYYNPRVVREFIKENGVPPMAYPGCIDPIESYEDWKARQPKE